MSQYYVPQGGVWDTVLDIGKTVGGSVLNVYGQQQRTQGQNELLAAQVAAQQAAGGGAPGTTPSWVLPVAILGGVGLLAVVLLK